MSPLSQLSVGSPGNSRFLLSFIFIESNIKDKYHRVVFPNRKKCREKNEIVHKKYLLSEDLYEFGPLLFGINKERCREGKFLDYQETLNIQNVTPLEAEVSFCFLDDGSEKVDPCFFLEPSELSLKPNESKVIETHYNLLNPLFICLLIINFFFVKANQNIRDAQREQAIRGHFDLLY